MRRRLKLVARPVPALLASLGLRACLARDGARRSRATCVTSIHRERMELPHIRTTFPHIVTKKTPSRRRKKWHFSECLRSSLHVVTDRSWHVVHMESLTIFLTPRYSSTKIFRWQAIDTMSTVDARGSQAGCARNACQTVRLCETPHDQGDK